MEGFLMENGKMEKYTEKEKIYLKMDRFTKESIWKIKKMGLEFSISVRIKNILDSGKMTNLTGKG